MSVAPNWRANSNRDGFRSTAMTVEQPANFAAITAEIPTDPAPKTTRAVPAFGLRLLRTAPAPVWMPQPKGPRSASVSFDNSPSTLTTFRSVTIECLANEDCCKKVALMLSPCRCTECEPSGPLPLNVLAVNYTQYPRAPSAPLPHT